MKKFNQLKLVVPICKRLKGLSYNFVTPQAMFCVHELAVGASLSRAEPVPRGPTVWARPNATPLATFNPVPVEAPASERSNVQSSTTNYSKGNITSGSPT